MGGERGREMKVDWGTKIIVKGWAVGRGVAKKGGRRMGR